MPFQSVPKTVQISVNATLFGEQCTNTFYALKDPAYDQTDLDNIAEAVDAWVTEELKPLLHSGWVYVNTVVRGLEDAIDLISEVNTGAGAGGAGGSGLANNAAFAVKRRSAFTGRGARGRVFIGGIPTSGLTDNNTVTATFANALEAALNLMQTALDGVGFTEVIVHRVAAGVPLVPAVTFTLVEYTVVNLVIDSMRRRLPGRGV